MKFLAKFLVVYFLLKEIIKDYKMSEFRLKYNKAFENYYNSENYYNANINFQMNELFSANAEIQWNS